MPDASHRRRQPGARGRIFGSRGAGGGLRRGGGLCKIVVRGGARLLRDRWHGHVPVPAPSVHSARPAQGSSEPGVQGRVRQGYQAAVALSGDQSAPAGGAARAPGGGGVRHDAQLPLRTQGPAQPRGEHRHALPLPHHAAGATPAGHAQLVVQDVCPVELVRAARPRPPSLTPCSPQASGRVATTPHGHLTRAPVCTGCAPQISKRTSPPS